MRGWKEIDLAYLAGLFDGEGCVSIVHHRRGHTRKLPMYHELYVSIASTNEQVLVWVKNLLGFGQLHKKKCAGYPGARKDIWYWECTNKGAEDFIRIIKPFLKIKRPQAKEALAFRARRKSGVTIFEDCIKMKHLNGRSEKCRICAA